MLSITFSKPCTRDKSENHATRTYLVISCVSWFLFSKPHTECISARSVHHPNCRVCESEGEPKFEHTIVVMCFAQERVHTSLCKPRFHPKTVKVTLPTMLDHIFSVCKLWNLKVLGTTHLNDANLQRLATPNAAALLTRNAAVGCTWPLTSPLWQECVRPCMRYPR